MAHCTKALDGLWIKNVEDGLKILLSFCTLHAILKNRLYQDCDI